MKRSRLVFASLLAVLAGAACSAPDSVLGVRSVLSPTPGVQPSSDEVATTDDYWLHLVGAGVIDSPCGNPWDCTNGMQPDIVFNAVRKFNGTVAGWVHVPGYSIDFPVVSLVPPSATYTHWCVEFEVIYPDNPDDHSVHGMLYVRDWGDGISAFDQIALGGGGTADVGSTCAGHPAPLDLDPPDGIENWHSLSSGDYNGQMKQK